MLKLEKLNELFLQVTCDGGGSDILYTKAGAFVTGMSGGHKNYQFEKVLLGPQGNPLQAALGQLTRRFTGENLPLMKVKFGGPSVTYYANDQQHVIVYQLQYGETISVESENILAFTSDCKYGVRFLAQGVISQKGLATSTLTGQGPNAYVAVLVDGNPLAVSNKGNNNCIEVDPDAVVCWVGSDPGFKMDLSWKNFIGQASGETYMFEWTPDRPAIVIIQPQERTSGIDISMDGRRSGSRPGQQERISGRQTASDIGDALGQAGRMLGGGTGGTQPTGGSAGRLLDGLLHM